MRTRRTHQSSSNYEELHEVQVEDEKNSSEFFEIDQCGDAGLGNEKNSSEFFEIDQCGDAGLGNEKNSSEFFECESRRPFGFSKTCGLLLSQVL
jgi:hypothetical protein